MRSCARLRSVLIAALHCLLACVLISGCGGSAASRPDSPAEARTTPLLAGESPLPLTLPSPAELLRSSSAVDVYRAARGADYLAPSARVSVNGTEGLFSPDDSGSGLTAAAYAVYHLNISGYNGERQIEWSWQLQAKPDYFWLALANFRTQRWDFTTGPGGSLLPENIEDYSDAVSGDVFVLVIVQGDSDARLKWIRCGTNVAPIAALTISPEESTVPADLTYDASGSVDLDGDIVGYSFELADGGYAIQTDPLLHAVASESVHGLGVTVTDNSGDRATAAVDVFIRDFQQLSLDIQPNSGMAPLPVRLHADLGNQVTTPLVQFEWDFEGDGTYDETTTNLDTVDFVQSNAGIFTPTLRATDIYGNTKVVTSSLDVAADDGQARWRFSLPSWHTRVNAMDMLVLDGRPAIIWRSMLDQQYTDGKIFLSLADDAQGQTWADPVEIAAEQYDGGVPESYAPRLHAMVVQGRPAIAWVNPVSAGTQVCYCRALDALGSAWGPVQTVDTGAAGDEYVYCDMTLVNGRPAIAWDGFDSELRYARALDAEGASWPQPQAIAGLVGFDLSLRVVSGKPAVCYETYDLLYLQALDADGSAWQPLPTLIADKGATPCLREIEGKPIIVYSERRNSGDTQTRLLLRRATDADGFGWDSPLTLDETPGFQGLFPSLAIIGGKPAISYNSDPADSYGGINLISSSDSAGASWGSGADIIDTIWPGADQTTLLELPGGETAIAHAQAVGDLEFAVYY